MTASLNSRPSGFSSGSSSPTVRERAVRVYQYRRILKLLVRRDLKVRYAGSLLGYVWTILDPLLMSLVYWAVFTKVFHRTAGKEFVPYLLYLVSGQLIWSWFANGVSGVTTALRSEAQMVRSSNVPRELWVIRVIASKGVEYFFGLPVLALFALAYLKAPCRYIYLLPIAWVLIVILLLGLGLILAPLTVLVRDLERVVPIVMRVLFYCSPVLYSVSSAPKSVQTIFSVNPTVGFLEITHATFFPSALYERVPRHRHGHVLTQNGQIVYHTISHTSWLWHSAITSCVILAIGVFVFIRLERPVLKEI